jgi:hypothetical protein
MGEEPGAVSASVGGQAGAETPEQLRREIEETRQELGDTVAALADKTDVKSRAREKVAEVRRTVTDKRAELMDHARQASPEGASSAAVQLKGRARDNPVPVAALAAFVGGFLAGRISARR